MGSVSTRSGARFPDLHFTDAGVLPVAPNRRRPPAALEVTERVDRDAVDPHLEVHVRARSSSRVPGVGDHLALPDLLTDRDGYVVLCPYAVARPFPWSTTTRFP